MKKKIILSLCLCVAFCFLSKAQLKPAMINDPDGFTNIRSGRGVNFDVVGQIHKDDLFYCDSSCNGWWSVYFLISDTVQRMKQLEGYVHSSKVQLLKDLPDSSQKNLILTVLSTFKKLNERQTALFRKYNHVTNKWKSPADSIAYQKVYPKSWNYSDMKYDYILNIFPSYFCRTQDTVVFQLFLAARWANSGSASEAPAYAIGECFKCQPDLVVAQISKYKSREKRDFFYDDIEFGMENMFYVDESGKSKDKDYYRLKKKLNDGRRYKPVQNKKQ